MVNLPRFIPWDLRTRSNILQTSQSSGFPLCYLPTHIHTEIPKDSEWSQVWKGNHIRRWPHVLEPFKCSTCVDVYEMSSAIALRRRLGNLLVPLQFWGSHESHSQFGLNANHLDELSVPYGLSITTSRHDGPMSFHRIYISCMRSTTDSPQIGLPTFWKHMV